MTVYFTSDLHLGHAKVAELRGFDSVADHDRAILSNIVNTLVKNDQLWILGDISSGTNASETRALDKLNDLTPFFDLHLIAGNHDTCHPYNVGSHIRSEKFLEVFRSINTLGRRRVPGVGKAWLSHFPYRGDGDRGPEERYSEVRIADNGDFLLHGHLHTTDIWTGPRSLHIGLDAWDLKPVHLDVVNAMIQEKVGVNAA
ncbi:metallophosphoesterase [Rhodococcoides fascians]|uniref:metallophosphoesterase n=1 Tax=Rhodococcoides fascians TaxID=1828 RepID=UPI00050C4E9B|nr:metallophosphoesterase [Rhodococcus fascians]